MVPFKKLQAQAVGQIKNGVNLMGTHHTSILSVSLVIPVYNEEGSINLFITEVLEVFSLHGELLIDFIFVNDGSTDNTLSVLIESQKRYSQITVVDLSRNFGKEAALSAGLKFATGQVVVPIDVDLQDPPEIILKMIEKWRDGYEVVLGRRIDRSSDSFGKRFSASMFYKLHNRISELQLPMNVGDFRLMDRAVVDVLNNLPEYYRFMKGLFAWAGFKTTSINYKRRLRSSGVSKFSGWKLWNFALEGITSFSSLPLRIWTYIGLFFFILSCCFSISVILKVLIRGRDVPGYASLMVTIIFFGGLQLIGIGLLGEYLGRTYIETKRRPAFIIRKVLPKDLNNGS